MNLPGKFLVLLPLILLTSFSSPKPKKINIVFLGDSITQGGALPNPSNEAPPVFVEQILKTKKQVAAVRVANKGFSGHTTVDFLPATNTDFQKVLKAANIFVLDRDAALIFSIMLGTNDSAIFGPNGSPISGDEYKKNLKAIIDALQEQFPQAKIVLQYPLWYSPNTHNNAGYMQEGLDRLQRYFSELDNLVKEYKTSHPGHVLAGDKSGFDFFKRKYKKLYKPEQGKHGVFYLHPNAEGSEKLAGIWVKGILKAIK